ncbi:MAG: biotin--[acetyl-CoA-carboxylase] ligase [Deltaproteobacteria bacterium]|nr:biotin--[acetyl-CoA-carboxylase] ligase [Deltaproteobacteria bacterium]
MTADDRRFARPLSSGPREPSLDLSACGGGLFYREGKVTSVLDRSWELFREGAFPELSSLFADCQSAGRGRFGRAWASPPGGVYASLRLPLAPPFAGSAAGLALAVLVCLALEEETGLRPQIKWPNDILLDGRKTGGILLENRQGALMAGIGLNVGAPPGLPEGRVPEAPPPGALPPSVLAGRDGPSGLWIDLLKNVILSYNGRFALQASGSGPAAPLRPVAKSGAAALAPSGVPGAAASAPSGGPGAKAGPREPSGPDSRDFPKLQAAATRLLYGLGRPIRVERPGPQASPDEVFLEGILTGLDGAGALVVKTPEGLRALWSGTLLFP